MFTLAPLGTIPPRGCLLPVLQTHVSGALHSGGHAAGQSTGIYLLLLPWLLRWTMVIHYLLSLLRMWFSGAPRPGTVVDLAGGNHADGTVVQLWGTNDTAAQFWLFQKLPVPSAQANNEVIRSVR